ncbi:HEPN domain-containing protein [Pseudomonas sp. B35(2017)]|uniref:HEPN domain-containing protein n=1 Tax=Pseudomonas sp. B35(2017) TaxID=1981722 RepID=UPI00111C14FB|nr:HEPN domain-containing protein [Pseudomonas sp. B35(2017)]
MSLKELIQSVLSVIEHGSHEEVMAAPRGWIVKEKGLYVTDIAKYNQFLEMIYGADKVVSSRFSRVTIFEFLNKQFPKLKISNQEVEFDEKLFFKDFYDVKPRNLLVTAPISGIRLDGGVKNFELSIYKFGYLQDLQFPIANESGMYVSVLVKNIYDKVKAVQKANDAFLNLAKIIVFMSGKLDRSISIETGLPLKPSVSHEQMYVSTSSHQVSDEGGPLDWANIKNELREKIPVNNSFFSENTDFRKLWVLYGKKHNGEKLNDLESRILNSALALGESAITNDTRNSIIYTCISLEILFSLDEGGLFQKSIGEKLSDVFSFIVAKDVEARLEVGRLVKKVYGLRSAIVHGGDKELSNENLVVNFFMRLAINELLNGERFSAVTSLKDIYELLKRAQNSY